MTSKPSKTFLADLIRRYMPSREQMARNKYLAPIAHRFLSPELWRFTRRSVPRGVAVGLFAAFIIPLGQILLAAFLAPIARSNVPLSALTTFITNPFTYPLWVVVANRVGRFVLNVDAAAGGYGRETMNETVSSGFWGWFVELFQNAGVTALVTVFGFVVLAVVSASIGYILSSMIWRVIVARKRAKLLARRS